jgi:sugar (pentulose or hexulose) kinase
MDMEADMKTFLGIELGSTRIKAVLTGNEFSPVASGAFNWENKLENGFWTYSLDDAWKGIQDAVAKLMQDYTAKTGEQMPQPDGIGISAMMHGYLVFDTNGRQLVPFRTWRNTTTGAASEQLTELFGFHIPQRWSIAHLYQAVLNNEPHVKDIGFLTTLAGYIHWKLTGQKVAGLNEASGMMPLDKKDYDAGMVEKFRKLTGISLPDILPGALDAGVEAGVLTPDGSKLLDPSGVIQPGVPLCPPEGDAGTGMVATNSVKERTGNISAGTSIFALLVLDKPLSGIYGEIDMMVTPAGRPAANVHGANCSSDIDAWINLFAETLDLMGAEYTKDALYSALFSKALEGDADCGGLLSYNYVSGEHLTGFEEGRPLFVRKPEGSFTLANFMRTHLCSTVAAMKLGLDILTGREGVRLDCLTGHGGLFKTPTVGQKLMASALNTPIAVMETAGEGGAWGIALLAAYMGCKQQGETLEDFLAGRVFAGCKGSVENPCERDAEGFRRYMEQYTKGLAIERAAVENF